MAIRIDRDLRLIFAFSLFALVSAIGGCRGAEPTQVESAKNASNVSAPSGRESIPQPPSWSFPQVIESARAIAPRNIEGRPFDQYGLAYSRDVLTALPIKEMPATELAKYADIVTHAYPDAVARQLPSSCKGVPANQMNETSVANIAYISLHATDPAARARTRACLEEVQSSWKSTSR